ncbi:MAG: FixH family protein [Alphaproteobacteria bacterium]|nr:FixH family protein [Alphaproteobacteria bacterium]
MAVLAPAAPRRSWIPWVFVLGMLLVVAVNGAMIAAAIGTFPGLSVERPYESGIAYNRILALQDRQDRLGWVGSAAVSATARGSTEIVVTLRDRDGRPLDGVELEGRVERPLDPASGGPLAFAGRSAGVYAAATDALRAGQWQLTLDGRRADGRIRLHQRLVVP